MIMWFLLAFSLLFLSFDRIKMAFVCLLLSCVLALYFGVIEREFFVFVIGVAILLVLYQRFGWLEGIAVLVCFALFFHMIAGFDNPKILDHVFVSGQSRAFSLYYNFDKALIPFILFALIGSSLFVMQGVHKIKVWQLWVLLFSPVVLLYVAALLGALKFEFHIPSWTLYFLLGNLFFVCLVEEALFRGYLQQRLQGIIGVVPALIIASILFGLAHRADLLYTVFASLAGVIYGLAWLWSGRLWVSILVHFGLNLVHLFFFTYPLAK